MVKESSETFEVVQVATATEGKIKSTTTDKEMNDKETICEILNVVKEIKRSVG